MEIVPFTKNHTEEAQALFLQNYAEERGYVPALPAITQIPTLTPMADNGYGVAAIENQELVGYLCSYGPWDEAFDTMARGIFSPLHGHAACFENRERIYSRMYQEAAKRWVEEGITYHAVSLLAHDEKALSSFFQNAFGQRCADAIRTMEPIDVTRFQGLDRGVRYMELPRTEFGRIKGLLRGLSEHMGESPCFMYSTPEEIEEELKHKESRDTRIYAAMHGEQAVCFLELNDAAETFIAELPQVKNLCGAYCIPNYRGTGILPKLLNFIIEQQKQEGVERLGVDYESMNPNANGAWNTYFDTYTRSVTRRIDEGALRRNKQ